jgi:hypothetical protein
MCGAILALSSCGTVRATSSTQQVPSGNVAAARQSQPSPRQRAEMQAAALLSAFAPPPGARRRPAAPAVSGGVLRHPAFTSGDPDIASAVSWWYVPDSAQAVLSYESAHLPRGFRSSGQGAIGSAAAPVTPGRPVPAHGGQSAPRPMGSAYGAWLETWSPPSGTGELTVEVADPASGQAYVRVDADVPWQPARPAGTLLPSGIRAVVVTAVPGPNDKKKPPAPVTVTDPGRVQQLVSLVNGLPLAPPGIYSCPMDDGRGVRLAFLARPGGAVLAEALAKANGCGGVALTIGRGQPTALGSGSTAAQQALTISGLPWRLSGYLPS